MIRKMILLILTAMLVVPYVAYAAYEPVTVELNIKNVVYGDKDGVNETFQYYIEAVDEDTPMPETTEIEITSSGEASFGEITYTTPDLYEYTIWQDSGSNSDCDYDDSIYHVSVYVTSDTGELVVQVFAFKNENTEKSEEIKFVNTYDQSSGGGSSNKDDDDDDEDEDESSFTHLPNNPNVPSDPDDPNNPADPTMDIPEEGGETPDTGDHSKLPLWIGMCLIALLGMFLTNKKYYK